MLEKIKIKDQEQRKNKKSEKYYDRPPNEMRSAYIYPIKNGSVGDTSVEYRPNNPQVWTNVLKYLQINCKNLIVLHEDIEGLVYNELE